MRRARNFPPSSRHGRRTSRMRNDQTGRDQGIAAPAPLGQTRVPVPAATILAHPRHLGRVIVWMTGALVSFSVMAVSIRELGPTLSIIEMLCVRAACGLAIIGLVAAVRP